MRRPSACYACRARRRRCKYPSGAQETACEYCISRGLRCVQGPPDGGYYAQRQAKLHDAYAAQENSPAASTPPTPSAQRVASTLPPMEIRLELVGLYFDYIHDQFHSMYHRPSFIDDVRRENVPEIILFAMLALSCRFSDHKIYAASEPRNRGEVYRIEGEKLFSIRDLNSTTVQACILLGAYAASSGDTDVENLYYTLAGRMCLSLDLPNRPVASLLERETNIRIWWTLCMIDVWSSTAVKLAPIMPMESTVPLPIDEIPFSSMSPGCTADFMGESATLTSPLLAEMIKLNRILSRIIDFNRTCASEHLEGPALENGIRVLTRDLDVWQESLPQHMRDTPENFQFFASRGLGRMFAAVYLGFYHYGQLLNYQFLSLPVDATSFATRYADACKYHASQLCSLVYRSLATPGSEVLYSAVSHILVIASTVQIHTLLFSSNESQIRISKWRLERNFEILLRLRTLWPSADSAMSRLRAFHQTCLRSKDTSFVLDRWLLRFLVQFTPHMELEPRDNDPEYEALWALSKQSPLSCYSTTSI